MSEQKAKSISQTPIPKGVVEIKGVNARGGIVELGNGTWMLAQENSCQVSVDRGATWGQALPLAAEIPAEGLIRLQSGRLAMYGSKNDAHYFTSSADEGKTWSKPVLITQRRVSFRPMFHSMIQHSSGRLLICGYCSGPNGWEYLDGTMVSVHPDLQYRDVMAYGLWHGQRIAIEGHGHAPEMGMSLIYRSDDEGRTWTKHPGGLMGWFDFNGIVNGHCGQTACFEPTMAETQDGSILLIARSTVGRLVQSYSTDAGEHWHAVRPAELSSSESPAIMVTLPEGRDLLIVWNQVSREEIRRGYRRGRLASAVSRDSGHSWEGFKTLELSAGLEDVARIQPEYPLQMVRARDWVGPLPDGWAYFHYANLDVVGDEVILRYLRGSPLLGTAEQNLQKQESVMRVYPLGWFLS